MFVIGLTGPSGAGKGEVARLFAAYGLPVINADQIYHDLLLPPSSCLNELTECFGRAILSPDGTLDRRALSSIVFSDPAALEDLNRITHGAVKQEVLRQLTPEPPLAAIDAIGLFESGLDKLCKLTVAVTAPHAQRISRLMARDNITREYALARIDAQPADEIFAQKCDFCLTNDGSADDFRQKCLVFLMEQGIIKEKL